MPILGKLIKRGVAVGSKLERSQAPPARLQEKTLRRLLRRASSTAFGQYYDFKDLLRVPDPVALFRQHVPVHDYDRIYDQWWHMTLRGVENVCWRGRVRYFALSSGTSGAPSKHIPVTDDMQRSMRHAGLRMFLSLANFNIQPELFTKHMLMLGGSIDLQEGPGYFAGDLSGINASMIPLWLRPYYKPGEEIARISNWDDRIEQIARQAPGWDVGFIVGIPSWLQLMMERILEFHHLDHIHQIWPNLQVCVHGGIAFEPYRRGFEKLLAHPLVYLDTYLASEGFIAFQRRPQTKAMHMLLHNGIFFEFIPFTEDNFDSEGNVVRNPHSLTIGEVREGVDYALLISSCAGAWRYLIGDTVRFTDKEQSEIIITGRTKHFLSICGEHLSVDNMNQGIQEVEKRLDVNIREFTVSAVKAGNFFAHKWYIGCEPAADARQVAAILDEQLRKVNDDYAVERKSVLRDIQVEILPTALFYQWQEKQGKMGGQNKFPRVMRGTRLEEWEAFVRKHVSGGKASQATVSG